MVAIRDVTSILFALRCHDVVAVASNALPLVLEVVECIAVNHLFPIYAIPVWFTFLHES